MTPEEIESEIEALVRDHEKKIKGLLRKRGFPPDAAEEAIDDALLAVALKWRRGETPDDPGAFLFVAARNAAASLCRRERRHAMEKPHSDALRRLACSRRGRSEPQAT